MTLLGRGVRDADAVPGMRTRCPGRGRGAWDGDAVRGTRTPARPADGFALDGHRGRWAGTEVEGRG